MGDGVAARVLGVMLAWGAAGCGSLTPVSPSEVPAEPTSVEAEPPAQPVAAAGEEPAEAPTSGAAAHHEPPPSARGVILANTVMVKSGKMTEKALVAELQTQLSAMHACVPLIRKTDVNVGSLNLEITVSEEGSVTPDLQSPANDEAERCILDGARAWRVSGPGSAMVLLMIQDGR